MKSYIVGEYNEAIYTSKHIHISHHQCSMYTSTLFYDSVHVFLAKQTREYNIQARHELLNYMTNKLNSTQNSKLITQLSTLGYTNTICHNWQYSQN